jgi:hypothetical protein
MEKLYQSLSKLIDVIESRALELIIVVSTLSLPVFIYLIWRFKFLKLDSDFVGLKVVEEHKNQILIEVRNPGNIRVLSKKFPPSKSLLIRLRGLKSTEFDFTAQQLRRFAGSRGKQVIKVDDFLYLIEGIKDQQAPKQEYEKVKFVDFEGHEVSPS